MTTHVVSIEHGLFMACRQTGYFLIKTAYLGPLKKKFFYAGGGSTFSD